MAGLLDSASQGNLPLRSVSVVSMTRGFAARTTARLVYYNDRCSEINATFSFPHFNGWEVVDFQASIEESLIHTRVVASEDMHTKSTQRDSEEASLARTGVSFAVNVGKIPPWTTVELQITCVSELTNVRTKNALGFAIPPLFTPIVKPPLETLQGQGRTASRNALAAVSSMEYTLEIDVYIDAPCLLSGIQSLGHVVRVDASPLADNASSVHVTLSENIHHENKEFELLLFLSNHKEAYFYVEQPLTRQRSSASDDPLANIMAHPALTFSGCLDIEAECESETAIDTEVIFMIDQSGSMNGDRMINARDALNLCISSLPTSAYFNIVSFGTYYRTLFSSSRLVTTDSVNEARSYISDIKADMGGTSFMEPLQWILHSPSKRGLPRQVLLVTDGQASEMNEVLEYIRSHRHVARIFTIGIGKDICRHFLRQLAEMTQGRTETILEGERLEEKMIQSLREALLPFARNFKVAWMLPNGYDIVYTPENHPVVYSGQRILMYAVLARKKTAEAKTERPTLSEGTSCSSVKEFWFEEEEFSGDRAGLSVDAASVDNCSSVAQSQCMINDESEDECPETRSSGSSYGNTEIASISDSLDVDDQNEVFLTEDEAERLRSTAKAASWYKGQSIDKLQSWKVRRSAENMPRDSSDERSTSVERSGKSTSSSIHADRHSADCIEIDRHSNGSSGTLDRNYQLGHPGYPTRHSSCRSGDGRSPSRHYGWDDYFDDDHVTGRPKEMMRAKSMGVLDRGEGFRGSDRLRYSNCMFSQTDVKKISKAVTDGQINTHLLDETNTVVVCRMLETLVAEKRGRLNDYHEMQEELVTCSWPAVIKECVSKQSLDSDNDLLLVGRDSGLGPRSQSDVRSDQEDDLFATGKTVSCWHDDRLKMEQQDESKCLKGSRDGQKRSARCHASGSNPTSGSSRDQPGASKDTKRMKAKTKHPSNSTRSCGDDDHARTEKGASRRHNRADQTGDAMTKDSIGITKKPDDQSTHMKQKTGKASKIKKENFKEQRHVGSESATDKNDAKSGKRHSMFSSFVESVKSFATKIGERAPTMDRLIDRKANKQRQRTSAKGKGHQSNERKSKKPSQGSGVKTGASCKGSRVEASRTFSGSSYYDHEAGVNQSETITLAAKQGMLYIEGMVANRTLRRLIPFQLDDVADHVMDSTNGSTTIHQLAALSIIRDLSLKLHADRQLMDMRSADYIRDLMSTLSSEAQVLSKQSTLVTTATKGDKDEVIATQQPVSQAIRSSALHIGSNTPRPSNHLSYIGLSRDSKNNTGERDSIQTTSAKIVHKKKLTVLGTGSTDCRSSNVSSPQTPSFNASSWHGDSYKCLVNLQHVIGYWEMNDELADALLVEHNALRRMCPFADYTAVQQRNSTPARNASSLSLVRTQERIWSTSLALAWLTKHWNSYHSEWSMVSKKATIWLSSQAMPAGFSLEDVGIVAQQTYKCLLAASRRTSNATAGQVGL